MSMTGPTALMQRIARIVSHAFIALALSTTMTGTSLAEEDDFEGQIDADRVLIGALSTALVGSTAVGLITLDPFTGFAADNIAFASNLALKFVKAPLTAPDDQEFVPTTSFTDPETGVTDSSCLHEFELPQSLYERMDVFGINIGNVLLGKGPALGIPDDWGDLGKPTVEHFNTHVVVTASNSYFNTTDLSQTVSFPAGNHLINWQVDTLYDLVFDAALPAALVVASGYSKYKRGEFLLAQPAAVDKLAKSYRASQLAGKSMLTKLGITIKDACRTRPETCVKLAYTFVGGPTGDLLSDTEIISVSRSRQQNFTVYDVHEPTFNVLEPELTIEAADFGGTFLDRVEDQVLATVEADDACGRPVSLVNDLPVLLPLGPIDVNWTVTDQGPNLAGEKNVVPGYTRIIVQDTQPPIIVPPPPRVIEVDPNDFDPSDGLDAEGVNPAVVSFGLPRVVDLADPNPTVGSSAPEFFPVDTRTEVTWSATDQGYPTPNTSTATQLITVKTAGTNTAPTVNNLSAATLTAAPVDIRLTGFDSDFLDGRLDPVAMEIVSRPQNGEFIAPLLPYFIEDFRTSPAGPYGDDFFLSNNRGKWLYDNVCRNGTGPDNSRIRKDWVYNPLFVNVTDDGTYYMIDYYWECSPSSAGTDPRLSKWDRDGNFLGQIDYGGTTDAFLLDQDGFIYSLSRNGSGTSSTLFLAQIDPDFVDNPQPYGDSWTFDFASAGDDFISAEQISYARVDSQRGLIYVNDRRRIFVYDVRSDFADPERNSTNGMNRKYLGMLNNGEEVFACNQFGSSWSGFAMEVDSDGNLFVADSCGDRLIKFTASGFDEEGNFVPGEYVGWMGRCDSSTNKSCDEETGTTKGYSCTDATCSVSSRSGAEPGQFNTPVYLALDPNDILYVADSGNNRIQRFATDGSFAGQAESTGTGINQGSNPSFVLGNMGSPKAVSVNSNQFFVVDQEESFINVFETTPLKDIDDSGATVTYVSNFDFHSASDTFTYVANDGLVDSNLGTVTVQVDRNFRPPTVESQALTTDEDTSVDVTLVGDDPDGIEGRDFNGLDTITLEVVAQPANGTLTGEVPNLSYVPNPDFFGEDSFTYKANDGVFDSEEALVSITVNAVDDPVRLREVMAPERVGRGFPTLLMSDWSDDGGSDYDALLFWGDFEVETRGDFIDPDGEEGPQPPVLTGVKLIEPGGGDGDGMAIADHVYMDAGNYETTFCISDAGNADCADTIITVEELANLAVSLEPGDAETPEPSFDMQFTLINGVPEGWAGLNAEDVLVELAEPEGYRMVAYNAGAATANCTPVAAGLECRPGTMAPGDMFTLDFTVEPESPAIYADVLAPVLVSVTTATPAVDDEYLATQGVTFTADLADDDGDGMNNSFEKVYGLNNGSNDAAGDADGDGLTNGEEFEAMTDPTDSDTDGDGVRDGLDPFPLDPSRSGDFDSTDLNLDGVTDAADVLLLQQALRGELEAPVDLNQDGRTDAADLLLLQLIVGGEQ